jgi:hypothetical protein
MKGITLYCANGECVLPSGYSRIQMDNTYIGIESNQLYTAPVGITTTAQVGITTTAQVGITTTAPVGITTTAPVGITTTAPVGITTTAPVGITTTAQVGITTSAPVLLNVWQDYTIGQDITYPICKISDGKIGTIQNNVCYYYMSENDPSPGSTNEFKYAAIPDGSSLQFTDTQTLNNPLDSVCKIDNRFGYIEDGFCKYPSSGSMNLTTGNFEYVSINNS